jgi:hypothetical protein
MGLDVYFIPSLNLEDLRNDEKLEIEGCFIKMKENDSSIMAYMPLDDEEDIDYLRLNRQSPDIVKYLAETYHRLVGADGFHNDAGYRLCCDGTIADVIDEMLQYKDEYGWSDEFVKELREKKIEIFMSENIKTLFGDDDLPDENYHLSEITISGTKKWER